MFGRLCVSTLGVLVAGASLSAQSVAVSAKMRQTTEIRLNGQIVQTHVQEGAFYRASNGSEVQQWIRLDGKGAVGDMRLAGLSDKPHDTVYKVDYKDRRAYEQSLPSVAPPEPSTTEAPKKIASDSVEGISCVVKPVFLMMPEKAPAEVGRNCWSEEYDLELSRDITHPMTNSVGKTVHSHFEMYDIQLRVEPDPKLFDLTGFTIEKPGSSR